MTTSGPPAAGGDFVLPPGQEDLVADMLGRGEALPGDCRLRSASIEGGRVLARYACAGREVELVLLHPAAAPPGALRTASVAIAAGAEVPPGLLAAVAARARERGGSLAWIRSASAPTPRPFPVPLRAAAAAAAVALVSVLLVRAASRRAASRLPGPLRARRWAAPLAALGACAAAHAGLRGVGLALAAPLDRWPLLGLAEGAALALGGFIATGVAVAALRVSAPGRGGAVLLAATAALYLGLGLWLSLPPPPGPGFAGLALPRGQTAVERSPLRPRVTYRTNQLGFRGPDFAEAKPEGALRIALVGDSYVFGSGVELEGTLSSRLAAALDGRGGPRPEVLNLGVPGDNLRSHVDLALAASDRLGADVVVVCLTLANDLSRWDGQDERREASRPGPYGVARFLFGRDTTSMAWNLVLLEREVTPEGLATLRRQLARLSVLRGRRVPRLVFFRFTPSEPAVDAVLREWPEVAIVGPPALEADDFIPGDGHPTAAGNQRFAALLAAELEREGLVGPRR